MSFQAGDVAVLKTTGEKVTVLGVTPTIPTDNRAGYFVRRPVESKENGLYHSYEQFYEFELETFEQQLDRRLNEAKYVDAAEARLREEAKAAAMAPAKTAGPFVN